MVNWATVIGMGIGIGLLAAACGGGGSGPPLTLAQLETRVGCATAWQPEATATSDQGSTISAGTDYSQASASCGDTNVSTYADAGALRNEEIELRGIGCVYISAFEGKGTTVAYVVGDRWVVSGKTLTDARRYQKALGGEVKQVTCR